MEPTTEKPVTGHDQEDQPDEGPPVRGLLLGLLVAFLYLMICLKYEKATGRRIHFVTPGSSPPCMPPQVGDFPDCHDPEKK